MKIIADKRIPKEARKTLEKYGEIIDVQSKGITYDAISGHSDIFFCQLDKDLVIASNTPESLKSLFIENQIQFIEGASSVGEKYPETAAYNAVVTDKLLIHNLQYIDSFLLEKCTALEKINVKQGYCRCNLIALPNNRFITSDNGIESSLKTKGYEVLFVNPNGIMLPGFSHGFIGGCCGIYEDSIFFLGSLKHFPEGEKIKSFLKGLQIIELYDGPLFDGGSLIFV